MLIFYVHVKTTCCLRTLEWFVIWFDYLGLIRKPLGGKHETKVRHSGFWTGVKSLNCELYFVWEIPEVLCKAGSPLRGLVWIMCVNNMNSELQNKTVMISKKQAIVRKIFYTPGRKPRRSNTVLIIWRLWSSLLST